MTPRSAISAQLEHESVVSIESTIPAGMTIAQWRSSRPRPTRRRSLLPLASGGRVVPLRPAPCDHLHESTTRYDHDQKLLTFLLVCPVCGTEKVVETQHYEPRYQPHPTPQPADESGGATIHQLPVRGAARPVRRAA